MSIYLASCDCVTKNPDYRVHYHGCKVWMRGKIAELEQRTVTEPNTVIVPEEDARRLNTLYLTARRMVAINGPAASWEEHYGAVVDALFHLDGDSPRTEIIPIEAAPQESK